VCIRYRGNVSTEPLHDNDEGIFTVPLPSNHTGSFTEPLPSNNKGEYTGTHTDSNGYVFCAVGVVSKESRRLVVIPKTAYIFLNKENRLKKSSLFNFLLLPLPIYVI
jgi:hypothetical protein